MGNEWPGDAAPSGAQPDDLDLRELEDELCRLTGILGVRIVNLQTIEAVAQRKATKRSDGEGVEFTPAG